MILNSFCRGFHLVVNQLLKKLTKLFYKLEHEQICIMLAPVIEMYVLFFKKLTEIVHIFLLNFQIRRSSYHDVVKVSELEDILDISDVQTYVINSARVVFLNERPQQRTSGPLSSSLYNCQTCSRALLNKFRFCSLGCNVSSYALYESII